MLSTAQVFNPLRIVIPAYNAERVVESTLADIVGWLEGAGYRIASSDDQQSGSIAPQARIMVVDDGSSDGTSAAVRRFPTPVGLLRNEPNRGKGYSVRRGVLAELGLSESAGPQSDAATPRPGWVLFMDVDNSTPIRHLDRFAPFADHPGARADVLIASRRTKGARIVKRQFRVRQVLGKTFPFVVRTVALPELNDTQCGFKIIRADLAARVFPLQQIERFAFDVELLMLVRRLGCRIEEIPVDWENPPESTLRVARDAPVMLLDVLKAVWRLRAGGSTVRTLRAGWKGLPANSVK